MSKQYGKGPEDSREPREFNQGYGEHEFGQDRERFRQSERNRMRVDGGRETPGAHENPGAHQNQSRWDRNLPRWQGHEGYQRQNEWAASHNAWSDPAHEDERSAGRYAEGGRYYGEPADASRERWPGYEGPHRGRGPRGYRRSDERIREDVCERLTHDSWLDAGNIEVEVHDAEVTLTGYVDSRQAKRRAEDTIENISGIRDIHNQLRIDAGDLQGQNTAAVATTPGREPGPKSEKRASDTGNRVA